MEIPEWLKPGLMGAAAGAVALAIIGFSWGGWVTGSSANDMAEDRSEDAVLMALTPFCVENSVQDPNFVCFCSRPCGKEHTHDAPLHNG